MHYLEILLDGEWRPSEFHTLEEFKKNTIDMGLITNLGTCKTIGYFIYEDVPLGTPVLYRYKKDKPFIRKKPKCETVVITHTIKIDRN